MDENRGNITPISELAQRALTNVLASPEQSTKGLTGSTDHKRAFLETFRRWEALFKRKDSGDAQADKWLIAEYYDSLGHLSPDGLQALTRLLKENCTFFPTIRECLDMMRPKDRCDWGHPFLGAGGQTPPHLLAGSPSRRALTANRVLQIEGPAHD